MLIFHPLIVSLEFLGLEVKGVSQLISLEVGTISGR